MAKFALRLQPSESVVINAAARIYAAYISSGQETLATADEFVDRAVRVAIRIAQRTEELVRSDNEVS